MLPPGVCTSTGTEMAYSLSSTRNSTGSFWLEAVFSAFQKLVIRRHTQGKDQSTIAIIRVKPVIAATQRHAGGDEERFVSGAGNLKEGPLLALEHDLAVVEPAGEKHQAIDIDHLPAGKPVIVFF